MIASAAHDLLGARERARRIDAVKPCAARLDHSNTLVNVWNEETHAGREMKVKKGRGGGEALRADARGGGRLAGISLASLLLRYQSKTQTSHSWMALFSEDDTFSILSFLLHSFFFFTVASAASTCLSSCPWGLIPRLQFILEEDRGFGFYPPLCNP